MTIGQQWAVIFAVFWAVSLWYSYSMGHMRGEIFAMDRAAQHFLVKHEAVLK